MFSNLFPRKENTMEHYLHKVQYYETDRMGIISPVTAVDCRYKNTTTFADAVEIKVWVEEFRGVKLKIGYSMAKADGTEVCEAVSEHCFLDKEGKIISLKRTHPEIYTALCQHLKSGEQ